MKKLIIILGIVFCVWSTAWAAPIEIVCVLDKSGSMEPVQNDIIGNFNTFLSNQKKSSSGAMFSLILFDTNITSKRGVIDEFKPLTTEQYQPDGYTALYDAIGTAITDLENSVTPDTIVIFAIITDGKENSSTKYTSDQIKYRISHFESWHPWTFLYLAANQDAFVESQKIGITDGHWTDIDLTTSTDCSTTFQTLTDSVNTVIQDGDIDFQDRNNINP